MHPPLPPRFVPNSGSDESNNEFELMFCAAADEGAAPIKLPALLAGGPALTKSARALASGSAGSLGPDHACVRLANHLGQVCLAAPTSWRDAGSWRQAARS